MTADKRRIDACLRACEGISTQNLEDNVPIIELARRYNVVLRERDALQAKVEAMEKQEPVAWCATDETGTVVEALGMNQSRRFDTALYLAPGAQPAPSVRSAALYPVISWLRSWLRNGCDPMKAADELEMLAAAPEAKP